MNRGRITTFVSLALILFLFAAPIGTVAQIEEPPTIADLEMPIPQPWLRPQEDDAVLQDIILFPVADTWIASGFPDANFGDSHNLRIGYNVAQNLGAVRTLLQFDIAGEIPDDVTIVDATLYLYMHISVPAEDAPLDHRLQRIETAWAENTVTWNTEPEWGPDYVTTTIDSTLGWHEWEITDLVTEWATDAVPNHGLQIMADEDPAFVRERIFFSSDNDVGIEVSPRLVVNVTDVPNVTVDPLPDWSPAAFMVTWSGEAAGTAEIVHYDVQFRVDDGDWNDWLDEVTFTEAEFVGQHGLTYDFRARGVDTLGRVQPFGDAQATTTVDTVPPVSSVDPLPPVVHTTSFTVTWTGEDEGSGIAHFDIFFRVDGGAWTPWLTETELEEAVFNVLESPFPQVDGLYEFEARAVDNVGNVEALTGVPDAGTVVDTDLPDLDFTTWFPLVFNDTNFSE